MEPVRVMGLPVRTELNNRAGKICQRDVEREGYWILDLDPHEGTVGGRKSIRQSYLHPISRTHDVACGDRMVQNDASMARSTLREALLLTLPTQEAQMQLRDAMIAGDTVGLDKTVLERVQAF